MAFLKDCPFCGHSIWDEYAIEVKEIKKNKFTPLRARKCVNCAFVALFDDA